MTKTYKIDACTSLGSKTSQRSDENQLVAAAIAKTVVSVTIAMQFPPPCILLFMPPGPKFQFYLRL
jgi:hypothetical protein